MSERDDGGPAYPFSREWNNERKGYVERETNDGISIRDYFAAHAMQGFLADSNVSVRDDAGAKRLAQSAYGIADAMLAERTK